MRQITNGRGSQTAIAYDNNERPQQVTFPTSGQPSFTYAYNYDDTVHSVTDGVGTTTVNYLANGAVQSVLYNYATGGLSAVQELDYLYYPDGSLQKLTWKNGGNTVGVWNYSYDAGGRLTGISNNWNENTGWTYDGEGKLTGQTNANSTSLTVGYNQARGWPTSLTYSASGGVFAGYGLTYDSGNNTVGLLTGVTENGGSAVSYGYDALYRLVSDSRTGTNTFTHAYGYDAAGNVQTLNGSTFASYDAANKFSSLANGTFSYDGDGDLTSVSGTGLPSGTFTWDDRGLLSSATAGGQTVSYGYNAGGQRVWSQVGSNPKTFYLFAGSTLIGEIQNGVPSVAYTWGANGLVSERLLATNRSLWHSFGPQGETRQLTDSTGNVADTYLYSPYGVLLASTGSDVNPFQYGGQAGYYADANNLTGIVLCGLRWYSPALGRWLSRDPIGYAGGPNLYEYCGSNPVMELDPFGMDGNAGQFLLGQAKAFWNHNFDDNPLVSFIHGMGGNTDWGHIAPTNDDQIDGHSVGTVLYIGATFFLPGGGKAELVQRAKVAKVLRGPLSMYKPGAFMCQVTASAARNALEKADIPFRKLLVQDAKQVLSAGGEVYSKTGYHEAIQVGNRVYDATTGVKGLPLNEWIRRGGLTTGKIQYEDFLDATIHRK